MTTTKTYSIAAVKNLLKNYKHWRETTGSELYPSQERFVSQLQDAVNAVKTRPSGSGRTGEPFSFADVATKKWQYGFIKRFANDAIELDIDEYRFNWALDMFEKIDARVDVAANAAWLARHNSPRIQEEIRVCADYYRPSGYYSSYIRRVDAKEMLTEQQYEKFCKNKYTLKALEAHFSEPLFKVGEIVSIRGSESSAARMGINKGLFVVSNTEPITSARKGCKKYKLLPVGQAKPIFFEEWQLKKKKFKKK